MKEVLSRRFLRGIQEDSGFERLPDLIMMDGGRGQVNIALEVLEEMDLAIPVCGMVKDASTARGGCISETWKSRSTGTARASN